MIHTPDRLERGVQAALVALERKWKRSCPPDKTATADLMNALAKVGSALGYEVYRRRPITEPRGEWLFDMTWVRTRNGYLLDVPLALECEWSPSLVEMKDDLEKLIVARAAHRVFVCYASTLKKEPAILAALTNTIRRCRLTQPRDRYLFACWIDEPLGFSMHVYAAGTRGRSLTSA